MINIIKPKKIKNQRDLVEQKINDFYINKCQGNLPVGHIVEFSVNIEEQDTGHIDVYKVLAEIKSWRKIYPIN